MRSTYMIGLVGLLLTIFGVLSHAQQLSVEQVEQALSIARIAAANEIAVKEQRIAALVRQLDEAQKQAMAWPLERVKPSKDAKVLTIQVPLTDSIEAVCFASECFKPRVPK